MISAGIFNAIVPFSPFSEDNFLEWQDGDIFWETQKLHLTDPFRAVRWITIGLIGALVLGLAALAETSPSGQLYDDGMAALEAEDFGLAEQLLSEALVLEAQEFADPHPDIAVTLYHLAQAQAALNKHKEAIQSLQMAISIEEQFYGRDDQETRITLQYLAELLRVEGRLERADEIHYELGQLALDRGQLLREQGAFEIAQEQFGLSQNSFESMTSPEPETELLVRNELGLVASGRGRFNEAIDIYQGILAELPNVVDDFHPAHAVLANNLGEALFSLGEYEASVGWFTDALARNSITLGNLAEGTLTASTNLAASLRVMGRYNEAKELLETGLDELNEASEGFELQLAQIQTELGIILLESGNLDRAQSLFEQAYQLRSRLLPSEHPEVQASIHNLAKSLRTNGKIDEAISMYQGIWDTHVIRSDNRARILYELASSFADLGDFEGAQAYFEEALKTGRQILEPSHSTMLDITVDFAELLLARGRIQDSLRLLRTADHLGRTDRNTYLLALTQKAELAGSESVFDEAFEVGQKTRRSASKSVTELISRRLAAGDDDLAAMIRDEQDLELQLETAHQRLIEAKVDNDRDLIGFLQSHISESKSDLKRLRQQIADAYPDYEALVRPEPSSAEEAQQALTANEALVVIDTVRGQGLDFVWVITPEHRRWVALETGEDEIAELVNRVRATAVDPSKDFDKKSAHALYQLTLGAHEDLLDDKDHLYFVINGSMASIPVNLLVTHIPFLGRPKYLIETHSISMLPSVKNLAKRTQVAASHSFNRPVLAFGDPSYKPTNLNLEAPIAPDQSVSLYQSPNLERLWAQPVLPDTRDEVTNVLDALGNDGSLAFFGTDASEKTLKELGNLSDFGVIYFATHAYPSGTVANAFELRPEAAIQMAGATRPDQLNDGLLLTSEIATLKLNAELVVLSACKTALVDDNNSVASATSITNGLVPTFMYAGANRVVAAYWNVPSLQTSEVLALTLDYSSKAGFTKSSHLQSAQKFVLSRYKHPFYWAGFHISGS